MRFKGQLLLPSEPGPGLRVDLEVAGHHLAVESDGGDLGAWPLEAVRVRRLEGDTFALTVAGEDLHFVADDTIGFAYSGVPVIESVTSPFRSRGGLRGLLSRFGSDTAAPVQVESPPLEDDEEQTRSIVEEPLAHEIESVADGIRGMEGVDDQSEQDAIIDVIALTSDHRDLLETQGRPAAPPDPKGLQESAPVPAASPAESPHPDADDSPGCPALTTDGLPCRSPILGPSGYCYSHDPERAVEDGYRKALEARAKMKRKGTAQLTKTYSRLEKAMRQVERGELEPDIAVAMAQIARTMCAILDLDDEDSEDQGESGLTPRF